LVAVLVGVRQLAGADGVEDDDTGSGAGRLRRSLLRHEGYSRLGMDNVLGLLVFVVYIALVISFAAGVTWLVVRLTPPKTPAPKDAG
jgi:hypothetical protein